MESGQSSQPSAFSFQFLAPLPIAESGELRAKSKGADPEHRSAPLRNLGQELPPVVLGVALGEGLPLFRQIVEREDG